MKNDLIINAIKVKTEKYQKVFSVSDNSELGEFALANGLQVNDAYTAARDAYKIWSEVSTYEKTELIKRVAEELILRKEEIAKLLSHEVGKPYASALDEVVRSAEFIYTSCEIAKSMEGRVLDSGMMRGYKHSQKVSIVTKVPIGVVLCISPFNYPINLSVSKIVPALLAGNTVVFKPATQGSLVAYILAEIFSKNLPTGSLNFITGKGAEIGDLLVQNENVDMVNFTGSTEVGKHIYSVLAESSQRKVGFKTPLMELGGKDVAIVTKKADVQKSVQQIVKGAFSYSGQRCTAVKKVLIQGDIFDVFLSLLQIEMNKLKVGSPLDTNVVITPLISTSAANYAEELFHDAVSKGMNFINPFKRDKNLIYPNILFSSATFDEKKIKEIRIFDEEQFAPILPVFQVETIDQAIKLANLSEYGLQSDVFTQDINEAFYIANQLESSTIQINAKSDRGPDNFPFAGTKNSGIGVQGMKDAIESMSIDKQIVVNF
ncbi:aldehyde dehydrogenase family protein [bacterium]|nr:MAG: aldehyde dehydrogenase family protein [bacterium]